MQGGYIAGAHEKKWSKMSHKSRWNLRLNPRLKVSPLSGIGASEFYVDHAQIAMSTKNCHWVNVADTSVRLQTCLPIISSRLSSVFFTMILPRFAISSTPPALNTQSSLHIPTPPALNTRSSLHIPTPPALNIRSSLHI